MPNRASNEKGCGRLTWPSPTFSNMNRIWSSQAFGLPKMIASPYYSPRPLPFIRYSGKMRNSASLSIASSFWMMKSSFSYLVSKSMLRWSWYLNSGVSPTASGGSEVSTTPASKAKPSKWGYHLPFHSYSQRMSYEGDDPKLVQWRSISEGNDVAFPLSAIQAHM